MCPVRKLLTPSCGEGPDLACRLVGRARLGRVDLLVLGRVDTLGGGRWRTRDTRDHHPRGVDLSDASVFPLEVSSPGEQVDGRRWQWSWVDPPHAVDLAKGLGRER
jgi:hypothetical protein